jgi:hypothetical protein
MQNGRITDLFTPTRVDDSSSAMAVDSAPPIDIDIDSLTTNIDINTSIDVDNASTTIVGIAVPTIIDASPPATMIDITGSTISDTASPSIADLISALAIDFPAMATVEPVSSLMGMVSARTGGLDMAIGLFNFCVDDNGVAELISVSDSTPPAADPSTSPTIGGAPSTTTLLTPSEEESRLETSTASVGSNDFQDSPPSPTTAYCVDCDAYHYVGAGDFLSHEIAGCEDPRGGTAAIYPTISECERAPSYALRP